MFFEQPPQRFAVLVVDSPGAFQVITRLLHGCNVSRTHFLHQASPRFWRHARRSAFGLRLVQQPG
jgi:hypothetical protein